MKYILIELQTNADGTVGNIVTAYDSYDQAESAWHSVLAAAAVSTLPVHAAVLINNCGEVVESRHYEHGGA